MGSANALASLSLVALLALLGDKVKYCVLSDLFLLQFRNFRENFIFANIVKRHICDVNNSRKAMICLYQELAE